MSAIRGYNSRGYFLDSHFVDSVATFSRVDLHFPLLFNARGRLFRPGWAGNCACQLPDTQIPPTDGKAAPVKLCPSARFVSVWCLDWCLDLVVLALRITFPTDKSCSARPRGSLLPHITIFTHLTLHGVLFQLFQRRGVMYQTDGNCQGVYYDFGGSLQPSDLSHPGFSCA